MQQFGRNGALGVFVMAALMGCAGTSTSSNANGGQGPRGGLGSFPAQISAQTEAPDLGVLATHGIPSGQCGMVLYAQSGASAVAVFRSTDDGKAILEIEGALTEVTLVGRSGETRLNIPSNQYFQGVLPTGMTVGVAAETEWGASFPAGSYVRQGTITMTAADGWSRVLPVAGIAGCKPASAGSSG